MADPSLKSGICRVKVCNVHSVTVTLIETPEDLSVIVYAGRACYDLLLAVTVNISRHTVVVSVTVTCGRTAVSRVKSPHLHEFFVLDRVSSSGHSRIVASACDYARVNSVKISNCAPEAVYAVAVGVSPRLDRTSCGSVVHGIESSTCCAVKERVVLRAGENISV